MVRVGGDVRRFSGSRANGRDRLLDRSIGLEQELFLVEESGEPWLRADEFLKRWREMWRR